jgi:hypothetical protein
MSDEISSFPKPNFGLSNINNSTSFSIDPKFLEIEIPSGALRSHLTKALGDAEISLDKIKNDNLEQIIKQFSTRSSGGFSVTGIFYKNTQNNLEKWYTKVKSTLKNSERIFSLSKIIEIIFDLTNFDIFTTYTRQSIDTSKEFNELAIKLKDLDLDNISKEFNELAIKLKDLDLDNISKEFNELAIKLKDIVDHFDDIEKEEFSLLYNIIIMRNKLKDKLLFLESHSPNILREIDRSWSKEDNILSVSSDRNVASKPSYDGNIISGSHISVKDIPLSSTKDKSSFSLDTSKDTMNDQITFFNDNISSVYRYSHIAFPSKVKLDDIKKLHVTIKVKPQLPNSSPMKISIENNADEVEILVRVFVDSNFFGIIGQDIHILKVPIKENDSNTIFFILEALREGNSEIKVQFLQLNNILEEVSIPCVISQNEEGSTIQEIESKSLDLKTSERFLSPDITVLIMEDLNKEDLTYRFYIKRKEETALRELGFKKFTKKDLEILQSMLNDIDTDGHIGYEVMSRLETKGHKIYNDFVPSEFKEAYWQIKNDIKSILIITADPKVPWELIKPQFKNFDGIVQKEDEFFCEKFSISRLLIMKGKSEEMPANETVKKLCLVIPPNPNLENVDKLRKLVEDRSNKSKITIVNGSQKSQLMYQLKKGDIDLLFISTHGKYNKESSQYSYIELEDGGIFRPDDIDDDISLRKTKPIVIMNTCKSAVQDYGISTVEGWVNAFIKAGASFFIGTNWNVSEDSVYSFTEYLFEELSNENSNGKKITIGEAVRNARIKSRSEGDPSWLAYQLYGHPNGIIRLV